MRIINKVKISLFISIFIIILLNVKAYAVTGIVTEITVNVREKASSSSKRIMYVTQDDKVEVLKKEGEWYQIKYNNKTGYVLGEYIKVDDSLLASDKEETEKEQETETKEVKDEEPEEEASKDIEENLKVKSNTKIRIIPNITSSVIYTVKRDTSINIIEQIEGWTYVSIENILGWVRTDKIVEENVNTDTSKNVEVSSEKNESKTYTTEEVAYIKYDTVNLREKASTTSKSLAKLKLNNQVTILEKVNTVWYKVKYDNFTGYISADLLADKKQEENEESKVSTSRSGETTSREETSTKEEESLTNNKSTNLEKEEEKKDKNFASSSSSKTSGEDIVDYAKKYLGYKYVYGGASPSTGFDCSGFTYYVYKHFGYTLSRSSIAQATEGKKVEKKDLQPGDLVIYKNTSLTRIGHVGIYIGNNKMIHASEPGVGVIITDIDSSSHNYIKRYVTARRILE